MINVDITTHESLFGTLNNIFTFRFNNGSNNFNIKNNIIKWIILNEQFAMLNFNKIQTTHTGTTPSISDMYKL
jgi:hypothetical protein